MSNKQRNDHVPHAMQLAGHVRIPSDAQFPQSYSQQEPHHVPCKINIHVKRLVKRAECEPFGHEFLCTKYIIT